MKKTSTRFEAYGRNPELGAIAIVVAALWMTLFGLAAFAVDIGYGYTNKRGLKAVADASVRAAMPGFAGGDSQSIATAKATAMALANGFTTGVSVTYPSTSQLQVEISMVQPTYFLKLFGMPSKTVMARSIGRVTSAGGAVLQANGGCGSYGLVINSNAASTINGNIQSNGPLRFDNGPSIATVNGNVQSACAGQPSTWGTALPPILASTFTASGTVNTVGSPFPNPFASVTSASFACTGGTSIATATPSPPVIAGGGPGGTSDLIPPGVYCTNGNMVVSDAGSMQITATGVTFVALGTIQIGANNGGTLSPAAGSPNGIIAFSNNITSCTMGQAINIGFNNFTVNGSVYAPNGCIRMGGNSMTITNGRMVALELALNPGNVAPMWTIGSGGGGGGGSWRMDQ